MILSVVVPVPLPKPLLTYIYRGKAELGMRVLVPLGRRSVVGLIVEVSCEQTHTEEKLKEVIELIDGLPVIDRTTVATLLFAASYYLCSLSDVLRSLLPSQFFNLNYQPSVRLLKNRHKKATLTYKLPSATPIDSVGEVSLVHHRFNHPIAQSIAACHLSGATLVIMPSRFEVDRLANELSNYAPVVVYHKQLSTVRRTDIYIDLSMNERSTIVVGTTAALGLSIKGLERIFITQEESSYYKSQREPRLSTRDLAVYIASRRGVKLFLMSELPSVDSFYNAHAQSSWSYLDLCHSISEPQSMRLEHGSEFLSKYLRGRIGEELAASRQVVVMQNRRGFGTPVCSVCSYVPMCPECNCSLTLHLWKGVIECHYCGHSEPSMEKCPKCAGSMNDTRGRGTERVVEQLRDLFPEARIERLDSDAAPDFADIVDRFSRRSTDIIVGTRVVADAIDYRSVGLVALVNADNLLSAPDFRASEDAFRLVYKISRRAAAVSAQVVVQTSNYANELLASALRGDALAFYRTEAADRRASRYPPFTRLIEIDLRSEDMSLLVAQGQRLETDLRAIFGTGLSALFQPQVERQQGMHVVKMLLRIDRRGSSVEAKRRLMGVVEPFMRSNAKRIKVELIVDPL